MIDELSVRQRTILKLIVQEYVEHGRAVGSKALIDRYRLNVSPATVRNDMVALEDARYLQHPHTSAGRVPTDRGYRYYVEHLLDSPRLPMIEQIRIRHQFRQVQMQIAASVKLAAAVLADETGNIAVVTPPRSRSETVRHFELISLRDRVVLLILVTQAGSVQEAFLHLDEPAEQNELSALSQMLNEEIRDRRYAEIQKLAARADGLPRLVLQQIADLMLLTEQQETAEVYSDGLDRAMRQPEFSEAEVAYRLLELMRGGALLSLLLPQVNPDDDLQIFIGSENAATDLRSFGVIIGRYGASDEVSGLLGILGPTRMPYGRSISTVKYLSEVLSDLLRSVYGTDSEHDDTLFD
jgi:heat-inducible transcriptional repressor